MSAPPQPEATPPEPTLPEPVRARVITLVAAAMTEMAADELPAALRKVARFAPHRRARLGGAAIATHLAADALFRQRAAARVRTAVGELADAVADGTSPGAADPVEVAALAYLLRPANWRELLDEAEAALTQEEANAKYQEIARIIAEDAVNVWVFSSPYLVAAQRDVYGFWTDQPTPSINLVQVYRAQ